jgi:hypothetical protein
LQLFSFLSSSSSPPCVRHPCLPSFIYVGCTGHISSYMQQVIGIISPST